MDNTKTLFNARNAGFVLGTILLGTMTGCTGYVTRPRPESAYAPPADVTVAVQDDYVYYPGYDVYYNSNRREYAYQEDGHWVSRPAPRGVSASELRASLSVKMDFHDSPANHHTEVVQKYPKNWAPTAARPGGKANHPDDKRDDNNGR
jgi:hypothetical protein